MSSAAGLLLAAGESRRFGAENKLLAPLDGRPLVVHAAEAMLASGLAPLFAVTASARVAALLAGFRIVPLGEGASAQSRSLAAGIAAAQALGVGRLAVVLGDMPQVTAALIGDVVARCPEGGASAAFDGARPMPPACFDAALFAELAALEGDRGAASILRRLPPDCLLSTPAEMLADIDTPGDLAALAG